MPGSYAADLDLMMNAREYKFLQDHPGVFRRRELADTIRCLADSMPGVARALAHVLAAPPIEKPKDHSGGAESDLFRVVLARADAREVCEHLLSSEAAAVSLSGETTALASQVGSLVDRWSRYAQSLDGGPA
jgi:hypothetical protein